MSSYHKLLFASQAPTQEEGGQLIFHTIEYSFLVYENMNKFYSFQVGINKPNKVPPSQSLENHGIKLGPSHHNHHDKTR